MGKKKENGKQELSASERLMAAATAVFADKGYAGASVNEIVERAGVTKPVLYYYFGSKSGLFKTILDRAGRMQQSLLEDVAMAPGTSLDRILYLYQIIYKRVVEHPDLIRLIHNLIFGPSNGAPPYDYMSFHDRMLDAIRGVYAEGLARGEFVEADPEEVAMLVLGLMDFCFHYDQSRQSLVGSCNPERLLRLAFKGLRR